MEPPLGFSVDALEPTGNPHEIDAAASLDRSGSIGGEAATDPAPPPVPLAAGKGGVKGLADAPSAEFSEALRDLLQRRK